MLQGLGPRQTTVEFLQELFEQSSCSEDEGAIIIAPSVMVVPLHVAPAQVCPQTVPLQMAGEMQLLPLLHTAPIVMGLLLHPAQWFIMPGEQNAPTAQSAELWHELLQLV